MSEQRRKTLFLLELAAIFAVMLVLNFLTPLVADDYRYVTSFATGERITSFSQLIPSILAHYRTFNGRVVTHFCAQLMLLLGKTAFNFLNAGMMMALLLGLYRLARGEKRWDAGLMAALGAAVFLLAPVFGQTVLWLDGACNYLWGTVLIVWVLAPYRDALLSGAVRLTAPRVALLLLGCLLMGATSENSSPAAVLLMMLCVAYQLKAKRKIAPWMWAGIALACIGWLIMIAAPSNFARNDTTAAANVSRLGQYLMNFQNCTQTLLDFAVAPCCAFLALFAFAWHENIARERLFLAASLFVCGVAANFAMVASTYYPARAFFGGMTLLILASAVLVPELARTRFAPVWTATAACAVFLACLTLAQVLPLNYNRYQEAVNREAEVMARRDAGNLNPTTYNISGKSPYDAFYEMSDISDDPTFWSNEFYARYYGLESVVIGELR